jgi:hypothetical protein
MSLSFEDMRHATCRIGSTASSLRSGIASSFFFSRGPRTVGPKELLITTRHAVESYEEIELCLSVRKAGTDNQFTVDSFKVSLDRNTFDHPIARIDLSAISIDPMISDLGRKGIEVRRAVLTNVILDSAKFLRSCPSVQKIYMVGYPIGLWDRVNNSPLVTTGVTATPLTLDFNGEMEFLVNCNAFPGSSGSPIFAVNDGVNYLEDEHSLSFHPLIYFVGIVHRICVHDVDGQISDIPVPNAVKKTAAFEMVVPYVRCYKAAEVVRLIAHVEKIAKGNERAARVA